MPNYAKLMLGALPDVNAKAPIDYLKKMQKCVKDGGGFSNCHLAAQLTIEDSDFDKLQKIEITEDSQIVSEWFNKEETSGLREVLKEGDVLNFDKRHYGVYDGKDIVQVPEWGAEPERVSMESVLKRYGPPSEIVIPSVKD